MKYFINSLILIQILLMSSQAYSEEFEIKTGQGVISKVTVDYGLIDIEKDPKLTKDKKSPFGTFEKGKNR